MTFLNINQLSTFRYIIWIQILLVGVVAFDFGVCILLFSMPKIILGDVHGSSTEAGGGLFLFF